jgi:hypothetical protein
MRRYLVFDAGCAVCSELAQAIEEAARGKLEAISIRDRQAMKWLDRAYPAGWEFSVQGSRGAEGQGERARLSMDLSFSPRLPCTPASPLSRPAPARLTEYFLRHSTKKVHQYLKRKYASTTPARPICGKIILDDVQG